MKEYITKMFNSGVSVEAITRVLKHENKNIYINDVFEICYGLIKNKNMSVRDYFTLNTKELKAKYKNPFGVLEDVKASGLPTKRQMKDFEQTFFYKKVETLKIEANYKRG